jgi:hypothetical protein
MHFPSFKKVARTFLEVSGFRLFFLLKYVLEKYGWYKICSSDVALCNKKKLALYDVPKQRTMSRYFGNDFCTVGYTDIRLG